MENYHLYLVDEESGKTVDDVVVKASNDRQAKEAAYEYFAEDASLEGYDISPEWGRTGAEADIDATSANSRTISL